LSLSGKSDVVPEQPATDNSTMASAQRTITGRTA